MYSLNSAFLDFDFTKFNKFSHCLFYFSVLQYDGDQVAIRHMTSKIINVMCNFDLFIFPFDVQVGIIYSELIKIMIQILIYIQFN